MYLWSRDICICSFNTLCLASFGWTTVGQLVHLTSRNFYVQYSKSHSWCTYFVVFLSVYIHVQLVQKWYFKTQILYAQFWTPKAPLIRLVYWGLEKSDFWEEEKLGTWHGVPNCFRTPILFNLAHGLWKCWRIPKNGQPFVKPAPGGMSSLGLLETKNEEQDKKSGILRTVKKPIGPFWVPPEKCKFWRFLWRFEN